jgi:hypothetical protein
VRRYPLDTSISATFVDDGTGTGSVARAQIGPTVYGTNWHVTGVSTQTTSDTTQYGSSQLLVYQDFESPSRFLYGSFSAENDTASGDETTLMTLSKLILVWTRGNIGAIATATLRGWVEDAR